jgi:hypothetical protein
MTSYEKSQNLWIIGGFVLISTICVSPMLFFGKTLVLRDTFFEFRFLYAFSKENLLNGIIPLWNPYSNCGQPFDLYNLYVGLPQHLFRTDGKGILKIKNYSDFSGFRALPYALQLKILKCKICAPFQEQFNKRK